MIVKLDSTTDSPTEYRAYLLRLWRETPNAPWRVLLVPVNGEKRLLFANLEALFTFLEEAAVPPSLNA